MNKTIAHCESKQIKITDAMRGPYLDSRFDDLTTVVLTEPPFGAGSDCISNSGTMGVVILMFILFSLAVQMSEGLCFGIVPFVSRPALGVVSGMVGAGGNAGSLVTNAAFFINGRSDTGFINMGILILCATLLMFLVYFPEHGGMVVRKGSLKYDPQLIKPPAGYRGADQMDYAQAMAAAEMQSATAGDKA
mmetsp:Transcript_72302/g.143487  ORF Transcript_72302/g.143487 Transcript_72302/m.143487 type:complete len:191 (-) Transcript_72302:23-595(-)